MAIDDIDKLFPEDEITKLSDAQSAAIRPEILKFMDAKDPAVIESFLCDIRARIEMIDGRIGYWEERRAHFLNLSLAILGGAIALAVAVLPELPKALSGWTGLIYLPLLLAAVVLFIGSILLLRTWNRQNNPNYPFTKAKRTWRWHYRHAEKASLDVLNSKPASFESEVQKFSDNLTFFMSRSLNASREEIIDQDLSQLYVVMTNEKFKVKFVSKLRDQMVLTLKCALLSLPAGLFLFVILKMVVSRCC